MQGQQADPRLLQKLEHVASAQIIQEVHSLPARKLQCLLEERCWIEGSCQLQFQTRVIGTKEIERLHHLFTSSGDADRSYVDQPVWAIRKRQQLVLPQVAIRREIMDRNRP